MTTTMTTMIPLRSATSTMRCYSFLLCLLVMASSLLVTVGGDYVRGGGAAAVDHPDLHRDLGKKTKGAGQFGSADSDSGTAGGLTTTTASTSSFETGCIKADNRTYNLTRDEANNGRWMNEARKANGLKNLTYQADLVVEAKRWAKFLASKQTVRVRDYLNRNLFCGISQELGEYDVSNKSVNKTGAFTYMMNGSGREYILYAPYETYGIGIAKNGSWYYMVTLFRNLK